MDAEENSPLVSVVIPTFNHDVFIKRAVCSALNQTYKNTEIIVVDNHSTDTTDEILASLEANNITVLKINNHGVIAASRNLGISQAKGKWIAFLDSDDFWYEDKLKVSIDAIKENSSIDVCCTNERLVNELTGNNSVMIYGPYCSDFYASLLINGNCLSPSAVMVKKNFLTDHHILFRENKEFKMIEDYDLWLQLAKAGANFKFINSVQGQYTIHSSNESGKFELFQTNILNVIKDHVYNLQSFDKDKDQLWKVLRIKHEMPLIIYLIKNGKIKRALKMLINNFLISAPECSRSISLFIFNSLRNKVSRIIH